MSKVYHPNILLLLISVLFLQQSAYAEQAFPIEELLQQSDQSATVLDAVIAAVDGEPITWNALRRFISTEGLDYPKTVDSTRKLVEKMVVSNLLVKEAEKAGLAVGDAEVSAYLERVRADNNVTEDGFEQLLHERGLTIEEYSSYVRQDILKARVLSKEIRSKIHVVDEDVNRYIAERPELKPEEGTLRLHEISLPKEGAESADQKAKLKKALSGVSSLTEFKAAGRNHYRDLGYVKISELKDELAKRLLELESGGVTELIDEGSVYQVYMVSSPVSSGDEVIDESLKAEIREKIFQVRYQEELDRFLAKELPKRYHVDLLL